MGICVTLDILNLRYYIDCIRMRWPWERWFRMKQWRDDFMRLDACIKHCWSLSYRLEERGFSDTPEYIKLIRYIREAEHEMARQSPLWGKLWSL